jgi:hypothetical protein
MKRWETTGQLVLIVRHSGRVLSVNLSPVPGLFDEWAVLALEIGQPDEKPSPESMQRVLDEHSHKSLGIERSLKTAMAKAEKFARAWQRERADLGAQCECDEIVSRTRAVRDIDRVLGGGS